MSTRQVQGTAGGRMPLFQGLGDIKKREIPQPLIYGPVYPPCIICWGSWQGGGTLINLLHPHACWRS